MTSVWTAFRTSLILMLLCGLIYPLATTAVAQVLFPHQAEGSLVTENGHIVGSELLAQNFTSPKLFHPRASAANYDPTASAATNAAVASPDYVKTVKQAIHTVQQDNPALVSSIPADLVTTSGSGFDPHLSPAAARAQIPRIAKATGLTEEKLNQLVDAHTENRSLGIFGEPRVNVLALNQDLLSSIK
ncbi:potassium-transporting ATPase subunit KdpC [Aneurinibacillus uraniidurans]|uniref:potassium-transporting ATPase subunit KdpC n=1 Tax=Aneurinibacillus uraniidurans TaxID=2966586 RepID=UPI002349E61D|nr:potassium-transporting ATPase subunit KdpC [Aneurinibacillus sp. B1]WCN38369.1 potassium-transporting ATPase subunit KdpC [Aneurinibacillus sp. B1]